MGRAVAAVALGAALADRAAAQFPSAALAELRCPFAKVWLEHGPERAAEMLGVEAHAAGDADRRRLQETQVYASCTYNNPWAGAACLELRGASWTTESATAKCNAPMSGASPGTLAVGTPCVKPSPWAGWCSQPGGTVVDILKMTMSCGSTAGFCTMAPVNTFIADGVCATTTGTGTTAAPSSQTAPPGGGVPRCSIAPGPIGAAHQLAQSPGYSIDCEGTPGQRSPYMWPLRWTALMESKSLAYTSDTVQYESKGRVWYMLDKNWKRADTWYQRGVQRAVGQSPCDDPVNSTQGTTLACRRNGPVNSTMLHRGDKMVFIDWGANNAILNCTWLSLGVIGNVRPDWFMDNRGTTTSVQYIGDSHVYYMGEPRLVKQWRKKDFANQYFTMSMQKHADANGTHWPLILNVPGEGFGDDFLQHWHEHRKLEESDSAHFLLDEAHMAAGGTCTQLAGSGGAGPPVGQVEHIPSNLELEEKSWREIVYTESPVWKAPPPTNAGGAAAAGSANLPGGAVASSCWDAAESSVKVSVRATLASRVWAAIGFRETEECLMTPRGGGSTLVVFAKPDADGQHYSASVGMLKPEVKNFAPAAFKSFGDGLQAPPLEGVTDATSEHVDGALVVGLIRKYAAKPASLNLTFAYGTGADIGYHASRDCFTLAAPLPPCPILACAAGEA